MSKRSVALMVLLAAASSGTACQGKGGSSALVHRHEAGPRSYEANAYWIESEEGIVLIDALFLRPDAEALVERIQATEKPLAGIIITHPHLDHFGGARWIIDALGEVPVVATRATAEGIERAHHDALTAGWVKAYGDDYATDVVVPDLVVDSGAEVELAGLHFTLRDFGAMEAENNTIVYSSELDSVFVGDALLADHIYYLGEGHSRQVLEQLPAIAAAFPEVQWAYSGHGAESTLESLIAENGDQVRFMRETLVMLAAEEGNLNGSGDLTPAAREVALTLMLDHFKALESYGFSLRDFLEMYILPGLEAELKVERSIDPRACC